jgi:hypothetical protein
MVTEMTEFDGTNMRIALMERVISLLQCSRKWSPEAESTLKSYYKVGGYFDKDDFEKFAKVKIRREE